MALVRTRVCPVKDHLVLAQKKICICIHYQAGTAEYTKVQTSCLCEFYYCLQEKKKEDEIVFSIQTNVDKNCNVSDSKAVNSTNFRYSLHLGASYTPLKLILNIPC